MSKAHIVKSNKFNPKKVRFSGKTVNKTRGTPTYYVNYEYDDGTIAPLRIQTPKLKSPFGISGQLDAQSVDNPTLLSKDSISLSIEADNSKFLQAIEDLDKLAFSIALKDARDFLKNVDDNDSVEMVEKTAKKALYTSVRYSLDKLTKKRNDFAPTFSGNIYKNISGVYDSVSFYDAEQASKDIANGIEPTPIPISIYNHDEYFPKQSDASVVMKCSSLWTSSTGFGLLWTPEKVRFWKSSNKLDGFGFLPDDDEDISNEVNKMSFDDTQDELAELDDTPDELDDTPDELDELDDLDVVAVSTPTEPVLAKTSSRKKKV